MPILDFFAFLLYVINAVIVPLIFAIAFLVFIWGIAQAFIINGGDPKKVDEGKKLAVYGIIGFFLMLSVWGLVRILTGTFGFEGVGRPALPSFGGPGGQGDIDWEGGQDGIDWEPGGGGGGQGLPLGAACPSREDSACESGECDWDAPNVDTNGQQIFVCTPQRTNN